jgi:hypothetical protein
VEGDTLGGSGAGEELAEAGLEEGNLSGDNLSHAQRIHVVHTDTVACDGQTGRGHEAYVTSAHDRDVDGSRIRSFRH